MAQTRTVGTADEGGVVKAVLPYVVDIVLDEAGDRGMEGDVVAAREGEVVAIVVSSVGGLVGRGGLEACPYVLRDSDDVVVLALPDNLGELGQARLYGKSLLEVLWIKGRREGLGNRWQLAGVPYEKVFGTGALVVVEELFEQAARAEHGLGDVGVGAVGHHGGLINDIHHAVLTLVGFDGGGFEGEVELARDFHPRGVDIAQVLVEAVEGIDHGVNGGGLVVATGDVGQYFGSTPCGGQETIGAFLFGKFGNEELHEGGLASAGIAHEDEDTLVR